MPDPTTSSSGASDWPAQATETIVGLVDSAKGKVNGPATSIARGIVYGTLGALVGTAALVLFLVLLVRGIDILADLALSAADADRAGRSTWIAHLLVGGLFLLLGLKLWRKGIRGSSAA